MTTNTELTLLFTGEVGVKPRRGHLKTNATYTQLTTAGFLNGAVGMSQTVQETDLIFTLYTGGSGGFGIFNPSITSDGEITLIPNPAFASNGQVTIGNIPKFLTTPGAFEDSGVAASSIITPSSLATDYQQFVGLNNILIATGTWTTTRILQGDYANVHTPGAESSNVSFDITPALREAAAKGFELIMIDVISKIGVLALTSQSLALVSVAYNNNVAVAVTSVPLTGSLSTATQGNPYVDNLIVATPAFLVPGILGGGKKYVAELSIVFPATTTYSLYGLNLHFTKTVV